MHALFYEELGLAKILDRKTHKPTCNEKALSTFGRNDVLLRPLTSAINQVRSLSNFEAVCRQPLDADGRLRCQYNIPGTETYRFASSSDPFGYGTNLQNLTSGDETDQDFPLPNLRKCIIPDVGYTIGEFDLAQADARVVAWEAEDETLISIFEDSSRDLHNENCETIFGSRPTSKHDIRRYYAKQGVHLTNYGGTADVLAKTLGITRKEADHFQSRWFGAHPKILKWHQRVQMQLQLHRFVENKFGYRRFYFDRVDGLLKEALAWIPQSTVAIATNLGILAVEDDPLFKKLLVQLLLQVHDSSVWQWPTIDTDKILPLMESKLTITVPYAKPLIFTAKGKLSSKSWGDCE
jgi:DNA polymerase-1